MPTAKDVMDPNPPTVTPEMPVRDLAELLLRQKADGACVVKDEQLVGVVTSMDLVFQQKNLHLPTVITFMEAVIPVDLGRTEHEIEKMLGGQVQDIMTPHLVTVPAEMDASDVATMMVERHISLIPVMEGGQLVGAVTKPSILRAAFERSAP